MKKLFLTLLSLALLPLSALCEKVTVNLEKEGTLETVISEQTVSDITELKIVGPITASDIKYFRKCEGKIANLESLDLSEVTLVASDEPYMINGASYYYLTDEETYWITSPPGGMYMSKYDYHHFGSMNLSMAFEGMPLETIVLPVTMTKVGTGCFKDCKLLTKVVLPEGITSIDDEAFQGAISLNTIDLRNTKEIGDKAFSGCTSLTDINLSHVETIGKEAFSGCTALPSANISNLAEVSESAFAGCTGLKEIVFTTNTKTICQSAFSGCTGIETLSLPEGLETIGQSAFSGCTGIETLSLPEGLETISQSAFENCTFSSVTLPNSIKTIDSRAFAGCSNLESVVLPNGLETIGGQTFANCKITSITFPSSLKYIGSSSFSGNGLASVTFSKGDGGLIIGNSAFYELWSLKSVVFEEGLESIEGYAFYGCGLESIVLPEGLKSINENAFCSCSNLSSVTLPSTLEYIDRYAFEGTKWIENQVADDDGIMYYGNIAMWCTDKSESGIAVKFKDGTRGVSNYFGSGATITSVEFPSSMRHIGKNAFSGQSITSLVFNDGLEEIDEYAFSNCNSLTNVVIPESVKKLYNPFGSYSDNILQMTVNAKKLSEDSRLGYFNNLTKLTIGSEVQVLPDEFVNSSNNLSVIFEDRSIESSLYLGSESLPYSNMTSLKLPNCRIALGKEALKEVTFQFEIPGIITEIGESALASSGVSGNIRLSDDITTISERAFFGCSGLTSVTIPNTLTSIGDGAFSDCSGLNSIIIPEGVTSIGESVFRNCSGLTSINIPEGVTSIGGGAFAGCGGLTSINIPDGVSSIGESAFYFCIGLTSVAVGNGVTSIGSYAFERCSGLTSINIPDGVSSIGGSAFYNCTGLTSVAVGNGVTSIGSYAFDGCTSLTEVNIPDMATWCNIVFEDYRSNPLSYAHHLFLNGEEVKDLIIPDGVTSIGNYAFYNCSGLTSATISEGVTSIGKEAFRGCEGLTSLSIPNSVSSIGDYAFYRCCGLTNIICYIQEPMKLLSSTFDDVPATATLYVPIGTRQLYMNTNGWNKFKKVYGGDGTIPENAITFADSKVEDICVKNWDTNDDGYLSYEEAAAVEVIDKESGFYVNKIKTFNELQYFTGLKEIGESAFSGCSSLSSINIPDGVTSIGYSAFYNCGSLTSVTIPNSVTSIGNSAFYYCGLTSVTIPNGVTSIGDYTFWMCRNLSSVIFGDDVTSIGNHSFQGCNNLNSMTLPSNLTSIGDEAFAGCYNLASIISYMKGPIELSSFTFNYSENTSLYVPAGSSSKYNKYPWYYFNIIEMVSTIPGDANSDGEVDQKDINIIVDYIMTGVEPKGFIFSNADMDGNENVNVNDIVKIVNIIKIKKSTGGMEDLDPEAEAPHVEPDDADDV